MIATHPKQAASALSDINKIAHRLRQSAVYHLAGPMLILRGTLTLAGCCADMAGSAAGCANREEIR